MAETSTMLILSEVAPILSLKEFKKRQVEAIMSILNGNDTFVSLPTGYGKSVICGPSLHDRSDVRWDGSIVVCVSPLASLMMDQQAKISPMGISTEFVGEMQRDEAAIQRVLRGEVQLVYISPENIIGNPKFREMFLSDRYKRLLVALAVDEAHCVKTW